METVIVGLLLTISVIGFITVIALIILYILS